MEGGDLKTLPRQHGGIFGLLGKFFGLGPGPENCKNKCQIQLNNRC